MNYAMVEYGETPRDGDYFENHPRRTKNHDRPIDMRGSEHFIASGGKLMENVVFRGIIDSLCSMNVDMPPLPDDATVSTKRTRYRARWAANKTVARTLEARRWTEHLAPLYWPIVCSYRYKPVLDWLKEKWYEIDIHPDRARSLRQLVSDCLVEGYLNG